MNEYQNYFYSFDSGYWANQDPNLCQCHGRGWALSDLDTWHKCPFHYNKDSRHPEDDYPECPECGDGRLYSPLDCPKCGEELRKSLAEDKIPEPEDDMPF